MIVIKDFIKKLKNSSLVKESKWLLIGNFSTMILSTFFTFFVAKKLGPSNYGVIAIIVSTVVIFQEVFSFRTWEAIIKNGTEKLNKDKNEFMKLFLSFLGFDFVLYLFVFLVILIVNPILNSLVLKGNGYSIEIFLYSIATVWSFNKGSHSAFLRIFRRYDVNSMINFFSGVLKLTVGVIVLSISSSINSYLLTLSIVSIFNSLLYFWAFVNISSKNGLSIYNNVPTIQYFVRTIYDSRRFLSSTYWVGSLKTISSRLSLIIISVFLSDAEVGTYKLFRDMISIYNLAVIDMIYNISYPRFASYLINGKNKILPLIKYLMIYGLVVLLAFFIGVSSLGSLIIGRFFSEFDSIQILLQLSVLELFFMTFISWMVPLMMCLNLTKDNLISRIVNVISLLVILPILTPKWGLIGVEISLIVSSLLFMGYVLTVITKKVKFLNQVE
jgi:O-antigen/teichoic acid export membrane protein